MNGSRHFAQSWVRPAYFAPIPAFAVHNSALAPVIYQQERVMVHHNECVKLEIKIIKYRALAR